MRFSSKSFAVIRGVFRNASITRKCRGTGRLYGRQHVGRRSVLAGGEVRNLEATVTRSPLKSFRRLLQETGLSLTNADRSRTCFNQGISCKKFIFLQGCRNIVIGFIDLYVNNTFVLFCFPHLYVILYFRFSFNCYSL
jgi:hypothetical protein